MNLTHFLELEAKNFLDRIAIIEEDERVTYGELWKKVNDLSKAFLDLGIKEGDRIAICLPNCKEYIYAFFAALRIHAVAVPLKQVMTSYGIKAILKDCHPSLLITDNVFLRRMLTFNPSVEIGKLVICSKNVMRKGSAKRAIKIDDLFKQNFKIQATFFTNDETIASINYTYRDYGYPLGAMLSHGNFIKGIRTYTHTSGMRLAQKVLLALPMSHVYSLIGGVIAPLSIGASIVTMKRIDAKRTIQLINAFKIDVVAFVPTFYTALLKAYENEKNKLHSVQYCFSGGSPLRLSIYQEVKEKMGWDIRQGYGLTECLPVTCNPSNGNNPASVGKVGTGMKVKVVDGFGNEKKINESGEIVIRGGSVMLAYYNRQKESNEVLKNGWCYTGDYGYFDSEGYLYFTGLKKRIAKVGGNIVDLREVEKTILLFSGVVDTRVDAVIDAIWGQILVADVFARNPNKIDARKLRSFLRVRLVSYKVPRIKKILKGKK